MPDGTKIGQDVTTDHDFIGRDVIYNATPEAWREWVYFRLEQVERHLDEIEQRFLITVVFFMLVLVVFGGLSLRSLDGITNAVQSNTKAINSLEWRVNKP